MTTDAGTKIVTRYPKRRAKVGERCHGLKYDSLTSRSQRGTDGPPWLANIIDF